ncbi:MAG: phage integrase SAM-like domain-containing protein [Nitrospirae bacterium]|nr:phage integrase SAM-like domain-containing protein [Nitrospirota bacterium]
MRLFQRKGGVWYVEIRRGVWRSLQTRDEREARTRYKAIEREALKGKLISIDEHKSTTTEVFIEEYLSWSKLNHAATTNIRIIQILRKFGRVFKNKQITAIRRKDIDGYVDYCKKIQNKPATINIEIRTLKSMFNKAVQWKYIKDSPFNGVSQIKHQKSPPQFLTTEQIKSMFEVLKGNREYTLVFAFYIYTGARRGEINNLKWNDIKEDSIVY